MRPHTLIVHHSASTRETTTVEKIRSWHKSRGFADIGYHYVIEADGRVRPGRSPHDQGAHDLGENVNTRGVCVVGDNTVDLERWNGSQISSLIYLMQSHQMVYGADFRFRLHREDEPDSPTECPGLSDAEWQSILRAV